MKKINLNKRGFTLVELLAVIVILAVIVLIAMNAVIPQMTKARKEAFVTEVEKFIQAAGSYYSARMLTGDTTADDHGSLVSSEGACINIKDLLGEYIEKKVSTNYLGVIKVEINSDNTAIYSIAFANNSYYFYNEGVGTEGLISDTDITADKVTAGTTPFTVPSSLAIDTCKVNKSS